MKNSQKKLFHNKILQVTQGGEGSILEIIGEIYALGTVDMFETMNQINNELHKEKMDKIN